MKKELGEKRSIKKWIILGIVAAIIIVITIFVINTKKKVTEALETLAQSQNATVSTMTLTKSVGATGTIKSINKKDMSVSLTGAKVESVNVAVGDFVNEGDLLLSFDASDIKDRLDSAKESLENAVKQSEITSDSANRNYNDAKRTVDYSIDSAKTQLDNSEKNYNDTVKELKAAKEQLEYYEKKREESDENVKNSEVVLAAAKKAETDANTAYMEAVAAFISVDAVSSNDTDPEHTAYKEAKALKEKMEEAYTKAQTAVVAAEGQRSKNNLEYQDYVAKCNTWQAKVDSYESSVDSLKSAYDTQVKAYNNTVASQNSALQSAKSTLESSKLNQSTATDTYETQVKTYEEQYDSSKLYAPFSGIITAINYEVGSTYPGGTVLTIQDCSDFIVETEISEYEISDIIAGQSVLIKTNATGDQVMNGKVTFVSPVATQASSMSTNATPSYTVKIAIEDPSDRLRLDMSASLSIIIEQHENAMVIPYNALGTDEEGKHFVEKVVENTTKVIYVDVVMESNYYTQIKSSELSDGDEILIIDNSDGNDLYRMFMRNGGRGDF